MTTDLAQYTYGDLVAALRKDLLLDAATDILPGSIALALGLASGVVVVTYPGSASQSNTAVVKHGMAAAPTKVVASSQSTGDFAEITTITATQFQLTAFDPFGSPPAGFHSTFSWIALL